MAKLIVNLPDQAERSLERLAQDQDLSVGEVLHRAVSLYRFALSRTASGDDKLSITGRDGQVLATIDLANTPGETAKHS